jgi:hypothetical protein
VNHLQAYAIIKKAKLIYASYSGAGLKAKPLGTRYGTRDEAEMVQVSYTQGNRFMRTRTLEETAQEMQRESDTLCYAALKFIEAGYLVDVYEREDLVRWLNVTEYEVTSELEARRAAEREANRIAAMMTSEQKTAEILRREQSAVESLEEARNEAKKFRAVLTVALAEAVAIEDELHNLAPSAQDAKPSLEANALARCSHLEELKTRASDTSDLLKEGWRERIGANLANALFGAKSRIEYYVAAHNIEVKGE